MIWAVLDLMRIIISILGIILMVLGSILMVLGSILIILSNILRILCSILTNLVCILRILGSIMMISRRLMQIVHYSTSVMDLIRWWESMLINIWFKPTKVFWLIGTRKAIITIVRFFPLKIRHIQSSAKMWLLIHLIYHSLIARITKRHIRDLLYMVKRCLVI